MNPGPARLVQVVLEETTLLASLVKWTVLAAGVGILVAASTTIFLWTLDWATLEVGRLPFRLWLLPPGFLGAWLLVHRLAPEAAGAGTDRVIEAVHHRAGRMPARVAPVKFVATTVTVAVGGSVGKVGPSAEIGAALASGLASLLRLSPSDRRKIVVCGISAGFATVFGTPIAGSIFGLEVLYLGSVLYDVLYPSFVAGIVAHHVSSRLGLTHAHEDLYGVPQVTEGMLLKTVLAGVLLGLVALLMIEMVRRADELARRAPVPAWLRALAGGAAIALLATLVSTRYLGLGADTIEASLRGAWAPPLAFFWKIVFTAVTLAVGAAGGIITPILFVGAAAGGEFGSWLGFDRGAFAAIGMVSLLASAANTPLSASVMAIELFGTEIAPFAAIACIVSFVMSGHRSVFPSQVLTSAKTPSVRVRRGVELGARDKVAVMSPGLRRFRALWRMIRGRRPR